MQVDSLDTQKTNVRALLLHSCWDVKMARCVHYRLAFTGVVRSSQNSGGEKHPQLPRVVMWTDLKTWVLWETVLVQFGHGQAHYQHCQQLPKH